MYVCRGGECTFNSLLLLWWSFLVPGTHAWEPKLSPVTWQALAFNFYLPFLPEVVKTLFIPLSASSRISQQLQVRNGPNAGLASLDFYILKRLFSDYLAVHGNFAVNYIVCHYWKWNSSSTLFLTL